MLSHEQNDLGDCRRQFRISPVELKAEPRAALQKLPGPSPDRFTGLIYAVLGLREHPLFHLTEEAFSFAGQFRMKRQRLLEFIVRLGMFDQLNELQTIRTRHSMAVLPSHCTEAPLLIFFSAKNYYIDSDTSGQPASRSGHSDSCLQQRPTLKDQIQILPHPRDSTTNEGISAHNVNPEHDCIETRCYV